MSDDEIEKLSITGNEYHALNMIEGLDSKAFYLVTGAEPASNGRYVLKGSSEAFDALISDVSDEIFYKLSPASRLKHLEKLYCRLSPDSDEF